MFWDKPDSESAIEAKWTAQPPALVQTQHSEVSAYVRRLLNELGTLLTPAEAIKLAQVKTMADAQEAIKTVMRPCATCGALRPLFSEVPCESLLRQELTACHLIAS